MAPSATIALASALFFYWGALTVEGVFLNNSDFDDVVNLVLDMQEDYKASNVFIIYAGDEESLNTTTLMQRFLREFSRKFVSLLTFNYSDVIPYHEDYCHHIMEPLFVVLVTSQQDLHSFRTFTAKFDMSYAAWLVIFTETTIDTCYKPLGNLFNLAFDAELLVKCHGDPVIREWYSLRENETIVSELATWDTENGFKWQKSRNKYDRRTNLGGKNISVVTTEEIPSVLTKDGLKLSGFFGSIFHEMSKTLNVSIGVVVIEEYKGHYNEASGQYAGAIGRLQRGEVDMGSSEYVMTTDRLDIVEFTLPFMTSSSNIFIRQPADSVLNWSAYLKVYPVTIWMKVLISMLFSICLITCARICHRIYKKKYLPPDHISENVLGVWSKFCMNGFTGDDFYKDFPKEPSTKAVYFIVILNAIIVYIVYTACLMSYLTVTSPPLPFSDMNGLAEDGTYTLIAIHGSAYYDFIRTSNDPTMRKLQQIIPKSNENPRSHVDGFKKVCDDRKKAFYSWSTIRRRLYSQISCKLVAMKTGRVDSVSFILKKKFRYRGIFNNVLLKFRKYGIIKRLRLQLDQEIGSAENTYNPVDIKNVVPVLCVLGIGLFCSVVILFCEHVAHKMVLVKQNRKLSEVYNRIIITRNPSISTRDS